MAVATKKKKIFDERYEILSIIGRGANSVVYRAQNVVEGGPDVALKVLISKRDLIPKSEQLRKEALAMVSCNHKYVVRLDDFHSVDDLSYLSMELAPESDLRKYIEACGGKIGLRIIRRFFQQTVEALEYIHKVGIIHRDVKPDNILVIDENEIRMGDFGIALLPGEGASPEEAQLGVGTMDYLPPEVLEGQDYSALSDIYSLGVSFYEAIAGKTPFCDVPLVKQMEARKDENIESLKDSRPEISSGFADIILRTLRYNSQDRFSTATEILDALKALKGEEKEDAPRKTTSAKVLPISTPISEPVPTREPVTEPEVVVTAGKTISEAQREETKSIAEKSIAEPAPVQTETATKKIPEKISKEIPEEEELIEDKEAIDEEEERFIDQSERLRQETVALSQSERKALIAGVNNGSPEAVKEQPVVQVSQSSSVEESIVKKDSVERDTMDFTQRDPSGTVFLDREKKLTDRVVPFTRPDRDLRSPAQMAVSPKPRSNLTLVGVVVSIVLCILVGGVLGQRGAGKTNGQKNEGIPSVVLPTGSTFGGALDHNQFAINKLEPGIYSGLASGVVPGKDVPLTLIALPDNRELTVFVGLDGWSPITISLDSEKLKQDPSSLRIAHNGFVFELVASADNNAKIVQGIVNNIVTGEKGSWHITPQM